MLEADYRQLENVLARAQAVHSPAEVHGILCGLLVHQASIPVETFVGIVLGRVDFSDPVRAAARDSLAALHLATLEALHDPGLSLQLMVMDDDEPLEDRVEVLCAWAGGLIYGLAQQGVELYSRFSEDTAAFLNDCSEIARGGYELSDAEVDETVYQELLEYLRLGTLMIQEEMQPIKAPPKIH